MKSEKFVLAACFVLVSGGAFGQKLIEPSGMVLAAPKPALAPVAPLPALPPPPSAPTLAPTVVPKVEPVMNMPAPVLLMAPPVKTDATARTMPATPASAVVPLAKSLGDAKSLNTASISSKDLKQNIDLKGLADQNPGGGLSDVKTRMMGLEGEGKSSLSKNVFGEGKDIGRGGGMDDLVNEAPIKGAKYGDTFGGGRINSKKQGDKGNFAGNGKGRASDLEGDAATQGGADAATIGSMLKTEGGTPTGDVKKDMAELAYAQSVGTDGYAATKNMTQEQRQQYWTDQQNKQLIGAGRPKEDDMGSGGGAPMGRQDIVNAGRAIGTKTGAAGGGGDGRNDQQQTGGGSGGGMVVLNKADGPERETGTGNINLNAVLKINQVADPVQASANR